MSGILESESDNDDSAQSSSMSSTNESLRQQVSATRNPPTGHLVQSRLEHFSRRLSLLGLASSQDVSERAGTPDRPNVIEPVNIVAQGQEAPTSAFTQLNHIPSTTNQVIKNIEKDERASSSSQQKVQIKFQPIGSIPQVNPSVCRITATQPFSLVITFLIRRLKVDQIYCYVNNSFAPNPQLIVGDLWSQFKVDDELIISYCGSKAFG
ncbi:ATG12 (YBR217W) [Zygosaccharomyces parabailii]|nr:ATG12 (YBR217W) [Zygosaccharomyces parabailii]CDH10126.1 related to Ubiquitin-like protein ATG12 [Zygosaccharomyces bailii ISA1307]